MSSVLQDTIVANNLTVDKNSRLYLNASKYSGYFQHCITICNRSFSTVSTTGVTFVRMRITIMSTSPTPLFSTLGELLTSTAASTLYDAIVSALPSRTLGSSGSMTTATGVIWVGGGPCPIVGYRLETTTYKSNYIFYINYMGSRKSGSSYTTCSSFNQVIAGKGFYIEDQVTQIPQDISVRLGYKVQ